MTMSQNDPGGFERNFLDSDVDLEIAHPSPGAEIYSRTSSFNLPSARVIGAGLAVLFAAMGGTYFYAFQQGVAEGQRSLPPVVLAENTPIKVPADRVPGGVAKPADDLNIYGVMRGEKPAVAPVVKPAPADNAPGTIESLISQSDDPFAEALAPRQQQQPRNSIEVLRDSGNVKVTPPRPELNRAPRATPPQAQTAQAPEPKAIIKPAPPVQKAQPKPTPPQVQAKPKPKPVVANTGGRQDFMVQLAASRSRALARGVYANLQKQYNDILGRRDPLFLRVDLGDKGIFYRVNVPGFANREAATQFCATLKKRGQDCLVRKQP